MMSLPVDRNGKPAVLIIRRWLWEVDMVVQLNHTIVWCRDKERSAAFLAEMLGRPAPARFGPFQVVELDNGVSLDFHDSNDEVAPQHYAFLIGDEDFDAVLARVRASNRTYWPDPGKSRANEINRNDGGRGFYFEDPDGHLLEVITRPYGSAS
jgi:catechol 2,3-dioxygenase-like lactoylglutathione lyase family enzyme